MKSEKLFQVANKEQILDEINKFNKRVSTLKVVLDKIEDENIYMRFSVEFGIEDSIFKQINFKDLIKLLLASSKLFMSKFLNEESNAVGKLFNE